MEKEMLKKMMETMMDDMAKYALYYVGQSSYILSKQTSLTCTLLATSWLSISCLLFAPVCFKSRVFAWLPAVGCAVLVAAYGQVTFWLMTASRQTNKLRSSLFQAVMRQEIGWFDTHEVGELNNRLTEWALLEIPPNSSEMTVLGNNIHSRKLIWQAEHVIPL